MRRFRAVLSVCSARCDSWLSRTMGLSNTASDSTVKPARDAGRHAVTAGILLLVASVSLNVFLAGKVYFSRQLQLAKASERLLNVGTAVPPIAAKSLSGQQEMLSYQASKTPTVLYVITPTCPWCARNMDNFK